MRGPNPPFQPRIRLILADLIIANMLVWTATLIAFHTVPLLLGTALLAYGLALQL